MPRPTPAPPTPAAPSAARRPSHPAARLGDRRPVRLIELDPDLAVGLSPDDAALAERFLVVPRARIFAGCWEAPTALADAVAVFVAKGMLLHEHETAGHLDVHLVGPGEYVDPRLLVDPAVRWRVLLDADLAVVDDRVMLVAQRCPSLLPALLSRLFDGQRAQQEIAAMRTLSRVEDRIMHALARVASRWGRVTPEGIVVACPVTHEEIGGMVGARRPTVSLALKELYARGALERLDRGRWRLPLASMPA